MSTGAFAHYARYYDLLYREKDYAGEARLVDALLRAGREGRGHSTASGQARGSRGGEQTEAGAGALLDVGCGTGMHAREFARIGWRVAGVDLSPAMIAIAQEKNAGQPGVEFFAGAAADFRLGQTFAAAVSLFHVVSYQAQEGEVSRMFANVRRHLVAGGRFVFDFWHGPGVLADPPALRVRRVYDERIRATRISEPIHSTERQLVDVNYEVFIEDIATGAIERINERHRMRYFHLPELEAALAHSSFVVEQTHAGLSAEPLRAHDWYGLIVARAVD